MAYILQIWDIELKKNKKFPQGQCLYLYHSFVLYGLWYGEDIHCLVFFEGNKKDTWSKMY